jgi:hypothetical protein
MNPPDTLSTIGLCAKWFEGEPVANHVFLLGKTVFFWGRIGKVMQLLASFVIFAEIIGPERLRMLACALRSRYDLLKAVIDVRIAFKNSLDFLLLHDIEEGNLRARLFYFFMVIGTGLIVYWLFIYNQLIHINFGFLSKPIPFILFILLCVVLFRFILALIPLVFTAIIYCFGLLMAYLVLKPIAYVLDREYIDIKIKVLSFFVLLLGSFFDLLAS